MPAKYAKYTKEEVLNIFAFFRVFRGHILLSSVSAGDDGAEDDVEEAEGGAHH